MVIKKDKLLTLANDLAVINITSKSKDQIILRLKNFIKDNGLNISTSELLKKTKAAYNEQRKRFDNSLNECNIVHQDKDMTIFRTKNMSVIKANNGRRLMNSLNHRRNNKNAFCCCKPQAKIKKK